MSKAGGPGGIRTCDHRLRRPVICSRLGRMQGRYGAHIHLPFRVPGVIGGLHAKPDAGAIANQLADPGRSVRSRFCKQKKYTAAGVATLPG